MRKRKTRSRTARGGLSHFTMRRFNAVPVSIGACHLSVLCVFYLVKALQHALPIPSEEYGLALLVAVGYGLVLIGVKARWRWKEVSRMT